MDGSPEGYASSQQIVPSIGWDMESPKTAQVSPRSVIIPRPKSFSEAASPNMGGYMPNQWGNSLRSKRRLKRPPRPHLYTRPSPISDTPEKKEEEETKDEDEDDWGDIDDVLIAEIRLTPLLKEQSSSRLTQPRRSNDVESPTISRIRRKETVFKTPTMLAKSTTRTDAENHTILPRKLTAEFDKAITSPGNSGVKSGVQVSDHRQMLTPPLQKPPPPQKKKDDAASSSVTQTCSSDDDGFSSGDDEELMRQLDIYIASNSQLFSPSTVLNVADTTRTSKGHQPSPNPQISSKSVPSAAPKVVPKPNVATNPKPNATTIPTPNVATIPKPNVAAIPKPNIATNSKPNIATNPKPNVVTIPKPNVATIPKSDAKTIPKPDLQSFSNHDVDDNENLSISESEMFDELDDDLIEEVISQFNASQKQITRTPPRGNTPEGKKQRLSLSLKKKSQS